MSEHVVKKTNDSNWYLIKGSDGKLYFFNKTETLVDNVVTFNSQGGSSVNPQTIPHGGHITIPANPTYSGKTFEGWYENSGGTGDPFDFRTCINEPKTLYAKWSGTAPTAVTITFASTPYANWNYTTQTAYTGDYLQISGFTVTCKNGGSSGATRWTAKLTKLPDNDTFTYTASITTTSRTVNSALTVSCTSSRSINWPASIDGDEFDFEGCPDIDINDVMSGNMYGQARLTTLTGSGNPIDLYDGWTSNGSSWWYCVQLITSGNNPYSYPHTTGIVTFNSDLVCIDWDSLEGGSGNAYSDMIEGDDIHFLLIYSAYNATDIAYNYTAGSGDPSTCPYTLVQMINNMVNDSDIEHIVVIDLDNSYIDSYK